MKAHCLQIRTFYFVCLFLIVSIQPVFAEDTYWVEVPGEASTSNITSEEARQGALQDARVKALRKAAELHASQIAEFQTQADAFKLAGAYREYFALFPDFIRSISYGRIIEETIVGETTLPTGRYHMTLKARVALETARQPTDFTLAIKLNQPRFTVGENLSITLQTDKDCYVTIFNLQPNGIATILLPDQVITNNFLPAGKGLQFPPEGMKYQMALLPGDQSTTEMILVVATREPIPFFADQATSPDGNSSLPDLKAMLSEFNRWLVAIPPEQRTASGATFDIVAKEGSVSVSESPFYVIPSRMALVIGNADYKDAPLDNPVNDANDMADVLRQLGFEVLLKTNVDRRTMITAIQDFGQRLQNGSVGLFYYSGHGLQAQNLNYLLPIDANIKSEADVEFETVNANRVLGQMEQANERGVNLLILDACRNNPYKSYTKGFSDGLAEMKGSAGSLIAYAAAPGRVAYGGSNERNSIYTKHLLTALRRMPQVSITDLLIEVGAQVVKETDKEQVPWQSSSLTQRFRFAQ
jgi:hypothetical protein